jgi:hypothetical protein
MFVQGRNKCVCECVCVSGRSSDRSVALRGTGCSSYVGVRHR